VGVFFAIFRRFFFFAKLEELGSAYATTMMIVKGAKISQEAVVVVVVGRV
jgi:hypothetical protein